jgi:hypothetical protein
VVLYGRSLAAAVALGFAIDEQCTSLPIVNWWRSCYTPTWSKAMSDPKHKVVELSSLKVQEGAHELFDSLEMEPYAQFLMAAMTGKDTTAQLDTIRQLPLEKRYVWRVASALKWGFADFDTENVRADRVTVSPQEFAKLMELLQLRPIQFCMFLAELVGPEEMQQIMVQAIGVAKQGG